MIYSKLTFFFVEKKKKQNSITISVKNLTTLSIPWQGLRQHRHQPRFPGLHTKTKDQSELCRSPRGPQQGDLGDLPSEGVRGERVRESALSKRCNVSADLRRGSVQRPRVQKNPETGEGQEQERGEHREMRGDSLHLDRSTQIEEEREETLRRRLRGQLRAWKLRGGAIRTA